MRQIELEVNSYQERRFTAAEIFMKKTRRDFISNDIISKETAINEKTFMLDKISAFGPINRDNMK